MLEKPFASLTIGEKFELQRIVKKKRAEQALTGEEQALYERFYADYEAAESQARSRWPIIALLFVVSLLAVLRQCS